MKLFPSPEHIFPIPIRLDFDLTLRASSTLQQAPARQGSGPSGLGLLCRIGPQLGCLSVNRFTSRKPDIIDSGTETLNIGTSTLQSCLSLRWVPEKRQPGLRMCHSSALLGAHVAPGLRPLP
jgi:hypothetical protein